MKNKLWLAILLFLTSCQLWDLQPPQIFYHYPLHNQYGVDNNTTIQFKFSEPMDTKSVEESFSITGDTVILGKFVWKNDSEFEYVLEKPLLSGNRYVVNMYKNATDKAGNALVEGALFSFYVNGDIQRPTIIQTSPTNLSENMTNLTSATIIFSESMDIESVQNNFALSPDIQGHFAWSKSNSSLCYQFSEALKQNTRYFLTINQNAQDKNGNHLNQDFDLSFLTGTIQPLPKLEGIFLLGNTSLPISSRYWTNYQKSISKTAKIVFHFSKPMNHTLTAESVTFNPSIAGHFEWNTSEGEMMEFYPDENLDSDTMYKIFVDSESAIDSQGFPLSQNYILFFFTDNSNSMPLSITNIIANNSTILSMTNVSTLLFNGSHTNTFQIQFNLSAPNALDISSFQNNVSISRIAGYGDSSYSGAIYDFAYNGNDTVAFVTLGDISTNNYYKMTLTGTENGIKDIHNNFMSKNVEVIFFVK